MGPRSNHSRRNPLPDAQVAKQSSRQDDQGSEQPACPLLALLMYEGPAVTKAPRKGSRKRDSKKLEDDENEETRPSDQDALSKPSNQPNKISPNAQKEEVSAAYDPKAPKLKVGQSIKLKSNGSFMRIQAVPPGKPGKIRGFLLCQPDHPRSLMPFQPGELVLWVLRKEDGSFQTEVEVDVSEIDCYVDITFTNQAYSSLNRELLGNSGYFCRLKIQMRPAEDMYPEEHRENGDQKIPRYKLGFIQHLEPDETDDDLLPWATLPCRISATNKRLQWRGDGRLDDKDGYTFADIFSGAGGTSLGAKAAGLTITMAVDIDEAAAETYTHNFVGIDFRKMGVRELLWQAHEQESPNEKFRVDVLHLSPPCQQFSGVNTTPNEMSNFLNVEAFGTIKSLIQLFKPRIVTLEEVPNLEAAPKHRIFFKQLVSMFISLDYSMRWQVMRMQYYGVAQTRERLIVIAAG